MGRGRLGVSGVDGGAGRVTPDAAHPAATSASSTVETPPRDRWPSPPTATEAGSALTSVIIDTFRLNQRLLEVAQGLAAHGGLTAAWWQVLGGVLDEPRTVADIGRRMGMSRQGVQRIADLLVERDLAEYRPNPSHQRAKLVACTEGGYWAIRRISIAQHPWADRIGSAIGEAELQMLTATTRRLVAILNADAAGQDAAK